MNAALRKALAEAQLTETDVAAHLGVDPKTVHRWLSGQRPYPRHRWALVELLQIEEETLWPQASQEPKERASFSKHAQHVYAHRWQVPRDVWWNLFSSAKQEIGILAYSGLFLADDAGILHLIGTRARDGVNVRILLGDPESEQVKQRGRDEQIAEALASRAKNALLLFRSLLGIDGVEIRTHSTVLYSSIYFNERKLIANNHVFGVPASKAPVVELDLQANQDLGKTYAKSFDSAWSLGDKYF